MHNDRGAASQRARVATVIAALVLLATAAPRLHAQDEAARLRNQRAELERILAFAGIRVSSNVLEEALRVVSPRMRHQRASGASLGPDIEALYARLSREAEYECSDF